MNDMIIRNRNLGLETVLQIAEERAPDGFGHITDVLSRDELENTAASFKKGGRLRPGNSQQSPILCRAAASRDMRHLVPSRVQQCQTPARRTNGESSVRTFSRKRHAARAPSRGEPRLIRRGRCTWSSRSRRGGNADTIARLVADKLTQHLRQPVIVENKPGAASIVAGRPRSCRRRPTVTRCCRSAPTFSTNPALGHKTSYDAERDLEPVALLVTVPAVVVVHPSLPVNTLAELIRARQVATR
jgi:hypothetical protein